MREAVRLRMQYVSEISGLGKEADKLTEESWIRNWNGKME